MPGRPLFALLVAALALAAAPAAGSAYTISAQPHVSEAAGSVTYTVSRTALEAANPTITVAGGGARPATPGADLGAPQPATLSYGAGETEKTVTVPIVNDAADEPPEDFAVTVSAPGATTAQTTTTIDDDDITVDVSPPATTPEGGTATVTLTPRAASARDVRVDYATVAGTAAPNADFTPAQGSVTWPAGDTSPRTVSIATAQDALDEDDESFGLLLASPADTLSAPAATITIADDDGGVATTSASRGDVTPPRLRLGLLRTSGPRVTLTVRCPPAERACRGRLTLFNVPSRRASVQALRSERRLAKATFRLAGGRSRRVALPLSAATRGLLRRAHSVRVRAYAVTTDAAGNLATTSRGATLRFR
ncbi:MAG: hypothetical protein E6G10_25940 [Actinobacteria bacterium]|nr:MAG: hypothetical protein E6G10_25940 [Actinomycetota bacterium]